MATEDETSVAGGGAEKLKSALTSKELLIPAALSAASAIAASKAPAIAKKLSGDTEDQAQKLGERAADGAKQSITNSAGGGIAGKMLKKAIGGGGGGGGGKKTRRPPIQRRAGVAGAGGRADEAGAEVGEVPEVMPRVLHGEQGGDDPGA